ncbi:hypothetical protein [Porphyrobacter sp. LM 6]|uniref:hypothetical protein n=1 Tax=Porphyrobacter sp. LM 6 TaxID=1896196 RepID=UPI0008475377|nr:hypothetical protein [Porphyrobacter sp. LM 6]AOL93014.1 hypothetical protein BG023_1155 [Porphyrobacter sp. LM 6]
MTWPVMARALFWLALAFTLVMALLPQPPALPGTLSDKVLHVIAFAVLTLLAALAYPERRLGEVFLAMAALGALIEVVQLIPHLGRDAEWADWLADCGAVLAVLALVRVSRRMAG